MKSQIVVYLERPMLIYSLKPCCVRFKIAYTYGLFIFKKGSWQLDFRDFCYDERGDQQTAHTLRVISYCPFCGKQLPVLAIPE